MKIYSLGSYYSQVDEAPQDLKPLLKQEVGKKFRRIDRFMQLALLASSRCASSFSLPADTAVYLTSGLGDLDVTIDVLKKIYQQQEAPRPLDFINSVSNATCFNIASLLKLQGRSSFVTSHNFAFERALELAWLEYQNGERFALVGSVDICAQPLSQHRDRIGLSPDLPVAEASHWWLLADNLAGHKHVAQLLAVKNFCNQDNLLQWLIDLSVDDSWFIVPGQYMQKDELQPLIISSGLKNVFEYCSELAFYNTQSAFVLEKFIARQHRGTVVHINTDLEGRYSVFVVTVGN